MDRKIQSKIKSKIQYLYSQGKVVRWQSNLINAQLVLRNAW